MPNENPSYETLKIQVEAHKIIQIREALQIGIENTQELLADYDIRVGRTTRSNRLAAERLEEEIAQLTQAKNEIPYP